MLAFFVVVLRRVYIGLGRLDSHDYAKDFSGLGCLSVGVIWLVQGMVQLTLSSVKSRVMPSALLPNAHHIVLLWEFES